MTRKTRITLSDVAAQAGVSSATASLVLGGKTGAHRISDDTHQRILEAARRLDYVPNRLVHSMQKGSTKILCFFDGFRNRRVNDAYRDGLTTALEKVAGSHGYDVLITCDFKRAPEEMYRHLNGGIVDGLIYFAPPSDDALLPYLRRSRLPTVLLGYADEAGVLSSVKDDVVAGMRQVADRLYELGHRDIAIAVHARPFNRDGNERTQLLRRFLAEKGVVIPDNRILTEEEHADAILTRLMDAPSPPTALFCWRDYDAYSVLECCEKRAIEVPRDLTVIGYDGLAWPLATRHKAASVKVDFEMLTEAAVSLLIALIHEPDHRAEQRLIPVTFKDGTTLAPPPAARPLQENQP